MRNVKYTLVSVLAASMCGCGALPEQADQLDSESVAEVELPIGEARRRMATADTIAAVGSEPADQCWGIRGQLHRYAVAGGGRRLDSRTVRSDDSHLRRWHCPNGLFTPNESW
jgi:hypothetical protein